MNVELSSRAFTYYDRTRTFSAEMSDFQWETPPPAIMIRSSKTGNCVDFFLKRKLQEIEDYDGELVGYEYESANGYKIHLYND